VDTFDAVGLVDGTPTWVLSNHDVVRETTRYGGGPTGVHRARAAALTMMALPGSAYVYQGEELGLEQVDVPPEDRQDPAFHRGGREGRDGSRVPVPWSGDSSPYGFTEGDTRPWLPMPADWADVTVEAQDADPASTLSFFRRMLRVRREVVPGLPDHVEVLASAPGTFAVRRGDLVCAVNCGSQDARLPEVAGELVLSSGPEPVGGLLAPDTAAWFRGRRM
jgi:alpha-glucosidase